MTKVALAHDYLSARGGAERVAVALTHAFPDAPLYTSVFEPSRYPDLATVDVRSSYVNRVAPLRRHYRYAMPLLPTAFSRFDVDADAVVCSSSGWSHGIGTRGVKVMYCHNPARWLYQQDDYAATGRALGVPSRLAAPFLRGWDRQAVQDVAKILANSTSVARRIEAVWGREAEVLPPPTTLDPNGSSDAIAGVEPGYILLVSRLLGYKNVCEVIDAMRTLPDHRLLVLGDGPLRQRLQSTATSNVVLFGSASEAELRWAYAHCTALVSASYEDFGLTPVEAALFGKPSVLLRAGGFLDSGLEGINTTYFEQVDAGSIASGMREMLSSTWDDSAIRCSAERFSEARFVARMRAVVDEVLRT